MFVIVAVTDITHSSMCSSCSGSLPRWTDSSWNYSTPQGLCYSIRLVHDAGYPREPQLRLSVTAPTYATQGILTWQGAVGCSAAGLQSSCPGRKSSWKHCHFAEYPRSHYITSVSSECYENVTKATHRQRESNWTLY